MALVLSTALRNALLRDCSLRRLFQGGELQIWSGSAPASADSAATGTRLVTVTLGSATRTGETTSYGSVTLTGGTSGSVDSITVNGVEILGVSVAYNGSLAQTAADVASQINKYVSESGLGYWAYVPSGAIVKIMALPGTGNTPNGYVVASSCTTITTTDANFANGVDSAYGLTWAETSSGAISKTGTWSGVVANTGTAGYFRLEGVTSVPNTSGADSAPYFYYRIQGTCGTTGADYNMSSTSLTSGSTHTVDTFTLTMPST